MKRTVIVLAALALASGARAASPQETRIQQLADRIQQLESRVKALEEQSLPAKGEAPAANRAAALRARFEARIAQDRKTYTPDQLREIETLYQVANRQWRSPEAQESLKTLIAKYDKANRTGCAVLYLGQMSSGQEKEDYLKKAIADFSDCWYGDGVQVGAYARVHLAGYCQQSGRADEARKFYAEIREKYPDAVDHNGNLLRDALPK